MLVRQHGASVGLFVRHNLDSLGIRAGVEVIEADAVRGLEKLAARHLAAETIFLDPPYEEDDEYVRVLEFLDGWHE